MRRKYVLLIIEDERDTAESLVTLLTPLKLTIKLAGTSSEGYKLWAEEKPDLVLLDLELPGGDGMELLRRRRVDPALKEAAVIVYTNSEDRDGEAFRLGAEEYFHKASRTPEALIARVESLIIKIPIYTPTPNRQTICFDLEGHQKVRVQTHGARRFVTTSDKELDIDVEQYDRRASVAIDAEDWRDAATDVGRQLFDEIFCLHSQVLREYNRSLPREGGDLRVCFQTRSDYIRLPLEFLYDTGAENERDFLIRMHPMFRSILGIRPDTPPISPTFLNQLGKEGKPLRVLLVASNTPSPLAGVDAEISTLGELIRTGFAASRLKVEFTCLLTKDASCDNVRAVLREKEHHIFHYAGHSSFNPNRPEDSGLYFWGGPNSTGKPEILTANELGELLPSSGIRFTFLNSCYASATANSLKLRNNFCLGLSHGILRAGVVSVLGHRFPVSDNDAAYLATKFYRAFTDEGCIVTALYRARREVIASRPNSLAWLSPVLLHQGEGLA